MSKEGDRAIRGAQEVLDFYRNKGNDKKKPSRPKRPRNGGEGESAKTEKELVDA